MACFGRIAAALENNDGDVLDAYADYLGSRLDRVLRRHYTWSREEAEMLNEACWRGHVRLASALLAVGVDPNHTCTPSATALMYAARCSDPAFSRLLVAAGARVTARELTVAAERGHVAVCAVLLGHNPDAVSPQPNGSTALMYAAREGFAAACELLVRGGADVNATYGPSNLTPLMCAAEAGHAEVCAQLVRSGAIVDATEADNGRTAMALAAAHGHTAAVLTLRSYGADASEALAPPYNALLRPSPLDVAVATDNMPAIRWLLRTARFDVRAEHLRIAVGQPAKALLRAASVWTPKRHGLFPATMKQAIRTIFLLEKRLRNAPLQLPPELWCAICQQMNRSHF